MTAPTYARVYHQIVDLDPAAVAALELDPSRGLWPVRVEPYKVSVMSHTPGNLPDTAVLP